MQKAVWMCVQCKPQKFYSQPKKNFVFSYKTADRQSNLRNSECTETSHFYRAMHFSAKCGLAIACHLSVHLSVTLVDCDHIDWNSSKIISPLLSLGCSLFALFATPTWRVCSKGNTPKFGPKVTHPLLIWALETFDCKLRPNGYR